MILIYSTRKSARLKYAARLMFENLIGEQVEITTDEQFFLDDQRKKVNYSAYDLSADLQIIPSELLFEKRIKDVEPSHKLDEGIHKLFLNSGPLGFDPLAAAFYLCTRYEEYLPHRTDEHSRFLHTESIAYRFGFLTRPVVEEYAQLLAEKLDIHYPHKFEREVTLDIDQAYAFRQKGWLRTAMGALNSAVHFRWDEISARYRVLSGSVKDPLDHYDELLELFHKRDFTPIFFLQVGDSSSYDHNGPSYHSGFHELINDLESKALLGIHPSYYSSVDHQKLSREIHRLLEVKTGSLTRSRQHYLRFRTPSTFIELEELGITDEYSMGYSDAVGFRASISRPYPFYNLERDQVSDLIIHPFGFMDRAVAKEFNDIDQMREAMEVILENVKQVGGMMSTVWHLESLYGFHFKPQTLDLLKSFLR